MVKSTYNRFCYHTYSSSMADDLFTVSSDYYIPPSSYLPPVNGVCEGYVFTLVCHSVHGVGGGIPACIAGGIPACLAGFQAHTPGGSWGVWPGGLLSEGGTCSRGCGDAPSWRLLLRAVRILLECILVFSCSYLNLTAPLEHRPKKTSCHKS